MLATNRELLYANCGLLAIEDGTVEILPEQLVVGIAGDEQRKVIVVRFGVLCFSFHILVC